MICLLGQGFTHGCDYIGIMTGKHSANDKDSEYHAGLRRKKPRTSITAFVSVRVIACEITF